MGTLIQDVKYAARMLAKHPGFTLVAILTLALGIGVNTAMFTVVNAMMNMHNRYADADELAYLWNSSERDPETWASITDYLDWREQTKSFAAMGLYGRGNYTLTDETEPMRVESLRATADLLPMLGLEPLLGRQFTPEEDSPSGERVALLTERLWRERYGASPSVLGRTAALNDEPYTVIGVLPPKFESEHMWYGVDIVTPVRVDPAKVERDKRYYRVLARLKPDVSIEQARAEMSGVAARLAAAYPETNDKLGATVTPLAGSFCSDTDRLFSKVLLAAVGLVLLIACANLANLLLAKATTRDREFAVRAALGAGRGRIIRQLLTESLLLALLGGASGLVVGAWALDIFMAYAEGVPFAPEEIALNSTILAYGLFMSLIAALAFGLAPALLASRVSLNEALKEGASSSSAVRSRSRLRNSLIVGQLATALPMLICCGLTLRHVHESRAIDFGYDSEGLISMEVDLPTHRYENEAQRAEFYRAALEKIKGLPNVENAGAALSLPVFSMGRAVGGIAIEAGQEPDRRVQEYIGYSVVSSEFFATLGVPLVSGRGFSELDQAESQPVAMINQRMAQTYWLDEDPVGKHLTLDPEASPVKWITIVGVIADSGRSFYGGPAEPTLYLPHSQKPHPYLKLVARTRGAPTDAVPALRAALRELDEGAPVHDFNTIEQLIHRHLRDDRLAARFLMLLAVLALALASMGLYGVIAYAVAQRTHEIGVRVALGADRGDIQRLVLRRSLKLTVIGLLIGLIVSVPIGLALQSQLYGVSGVDPLTYLCVSIVLLATAALAGYLPARRATRVDPMAALRCE